MYVCPHSVLDRVDGGQGEDDGEDGQEQEAEDEVAGARQKGRHAPLRRPPAHDRGDAYIRSRVQRTEVVSYARADSLCELALLNSCIQRRVY